MLCDLLDLLRPDTAGFAAGAYPMDMHGWGSDAPIFRALISELRPRLIVEVGSWKGASAIHMAGICKDERLGTQLICVDTWLGSLEMWTDPNDPDRYGSLLRRWGYPTLYEQFLSNIINTGHINCIVPFPQTSLIAARFLAHHQVQADLIYIDASHDETDVLADMRAYWPLVRAGGILFGDDWGVFDGAITRAVQAFGQPYEVIEGRHWVMRHD
jgi:hypothetical protein